MSKQLLFDCLNHKNVIRPPWVPFAGIHAGKLLGYNAKQLLTDETKLLESLLEVNKIYRPDGQPILFDLQVEAEILGCQLKWSDDTPPTVATHPLSDNKKVPCKCKMPTPKDGRLPMILSVMKKVKEAIGNDTALYGLVCGPFTLASHLRGNDLFMDMFDEPEYVVKLIEFCADFISTIADMYIKAGMDVIAVVDPLVSQISASHFEEFLTKPFTNIFDRIRNGGAYSSFFVCGNATRNIENMLKTSPDSISVDENIKIQDIKNICDKYNVVLGGNIPLTTVMLHGTQQDNMKYTIDLIDSMPNANQNFIVSPGCDMPYATPIENAIGVAQAILEYTSVKAMIADYTCTDFSTYIVELPDYNNLVRPLVEVFTLDSESCAACTYMMGMANAVKEKYGVKIDTIEYKFTLKENIARCIKMGVTNLPALYINGKLCWSSIIPSIDEFSKRIEEVL